MDFNIFKEDELTDQMVDQLVEHELEYGYRMNLSSNKLTFMTLSGYIITIDFKQLMVMVTRSDTYNFLTLVVDDIEATLKKFESKLC